MTMNVVRGVVISGYLLVFAAFVYFLHFYPSMFKAWL
jgi:hypothetical protein